MLAFPILFNITPNDLTSRWVKEIKVTQIEQEEEKLSLLGDDRLFLKKIIYLFLFLEREEGREKEMERNIKVQLPPTGDLACNPCMCLTGNWTSNPMVHRLALSPLSHTTQGDDRFLHTENPKESLQKMNNWVQQGFRIPHQHIKSLVFLYTCN